MSRFPLPLRNRVSIVREDLYLLTKDTYKTIILGQFVYWSERISDTDEYIHEETERLRHDGITSNLCPSYGWIYKKADELIEEAMLSISRQTANRLLQSLVDEGYLLSRNNPDHKYDRTKQYRVDFVRIQNELRKLGYLHSNLAWLTESDAMPDLSIRENGEVAASLVRSNRELNLSIGKLEKSGEELITSGQRLKDERAISEITTEITYREKNNNNNDIRVQIMDRKKAPNQLTEKASLGIKKTASAELDFSGEQKNEFAWEEQPPTTPSLESYIPFPPSELEIAATRTEISNSADRQPLIQDNDPYFQVDNRMSQHLGRIYIAKQEDYRAIKQLLESRVPLGFILAGIDYTFDNFSDRKINSFGYCAKVIAQQWSLEITKRESVKPIDWQVALEQENNSQHPRSSKVQLSGTVHHDKYEAFYNLFPG